MAKVVDLKTVDLLGRGKIHPALHVDDAGIIVGVVTEAGEYRLVTSERKLYDPAEIKDVLAFPPRPYPDLAGRWADEDLTAFLHGEDGTTFSEGLALIINALDDAMEFPRPEQRALIAVWSLATYFHQLFLTFPRMNFAGEMESGKSKVMTLLRAIAWNALYILDPTPAVLFRLIHEFRATMLLDEMESLSKEDSREIFAVVNSGYKSGGSVPRCEGERQKRVELFQVYAPMALAAIRSLNSVTENRAIPLVLQRGVDREKLNREVDLASPAFARIRSGCYQLLLTRWREVREASRTVPLPAWLNARGRELWKPLLAVAAVADRENGLQLGPDLLVLARAHVADREGISPEGEALLAVLASQLTSADSLTVRPRDLREPLRERLGWRDAPSPEAVGAWLRRFSFHRVGKDREGAKYEVTAERLRDVSARYAPTEEGEA